MVIKNLSTVPIDELTLIHPRDLRQGDPTRFGSQIRGWCPPEANWMGATMYHQPPELGPNDRIPDGFVALNIMRYERVQPETVIAKVADVKDVPALHPATTGERYRLFDLDWPTLFVAKLHQAIPPWDPKDPRTSCLVRFCFDLDHVKPITYQEVGKEGGHRRFVKRCFELMAPGLVLARLRNRLESVAAGGSPTHAAYARELLEEVIYGQFLALPSTTRIRDIRAGVVTDDTSFLLDSHELGAVGFWEVRPLRPLDRSPRLHAHVWLSGSDYYKGQDPIDVARDAAQYFSAVLGPGDAVSVEQVALAIGCDSSRSVRTVLEVLGKMTWLTARDDARLWAATNELRDGVDNDALSQPATERRLRSLVADRVRQDSDAFAPRFWRILFSLGSFY